MFTDAREPTIEWGHRDPAGIVFYPRHFEMFAAPTAALFAAAPGMTKRGMVARFDAAGSPMVDTRAKFHAPSAHDDRARVESAVTALRRSSFDVERRVLKGDALAVEDFESRVWVGRHPDSPACLQARPLPEEGGARLRAARWGYSPAASRSSRRSR